MDFNYSVFENRLPFLDDAKREVTVRMSVYFRKSWMRRLLLRRAGCLGVVDSANLQSLALELTQIMRGCILSECKSVGFRNDIDQVLYNLSEQTPRRYIYLLAECTLFQDTWPMMERVPTFARWEWRNAFLTSPSWVAFTETVSAAVRQAFAFPTLCELVHEATMDPVFAVLAATHTTKTGKHDCALVQWLADTQTRKRTLGNALKTLE